MKSVGRSVFIVIEEALFVVETEISRKHGDEFGDGLDGFDGIGIDFTRGEAQHEHAVKSVKAGLYLAFFIVACFGPKLDNIWQCGIKGLGIFAEARVFDQGRVKFDESLQHIAVELQMTFLGDFLAAHHVDKRLIPLGELLFLRVIELSLRVYDILADSVDIEAISTDKVLDLPHIKQILGYILFTFL